MEAFKIMGRIVVDTQDAEKSLNEVEKEAEEAAGALEKTDSAGKQAANGVHTAGDSAGDAQDKFSAWNLALGGLIKDGITKLISGCKNLVASVIDVGKTFSTSMSNVGALSGASAKDMQMLEETARHFGATTKFSASEAADAMGYMALAGWDAKQMADGLGGVLNLAAASGMGLAEASDMVTDYMSAFGNSAGLTSDKLADLIAYAQANANTSAPQLGEAYKNCAANLNAAGQDVRTVTACLEALGNQGDKGSTAGTKLSAIMRDISAKMENGAITIGNTAVSVVKADGSFRDLADIMADVSAATDGMTNAQRTTALSATFTADSQAGVNMILSEGADKVQKYRDALYDCDGAAADMAATMNDNLEGDLANLNSAWEEVQLKIYDLIEGPMRGFVQTVTDSVLPAITWIIEHLDTIGPVVGLVTGWVGALVVAFNWGKICTTAATAISWITTGLSSLGGVLAFVCSPIGILIGAIVGLVAVFTYFYKNNETVRNAVNKTWKGIQKAIQGVCDAVGECVGAFLQLIKDLWKANGDHIKAIVKPIWDGIATTIGNVMSDIGNAIKSALNAIKAVFKLVTSIIKGDWAGAWNAIKDLTKNVLGIISGIVTAAFDLIKSIVTAKLALVKAVFTAAMMALQTACTAAWNAIKTVTETVWNAIKAFFTQVWAGIKAIFTNAKAAISSTITSAWNAITSATQAFGEGVKSAINTAWNAVINTIKNAVNNIRTTVQSVWDAIKGATSSAFSAVQSTAQSVWNGIKNAITNPMETAKNAVRNIVNTIKGFFNFSISPPNIPVPHFYISPRGWSVGDLVKGKIPSLGVEWYAKAMKNPMILDKPAIFGYDAAAGKLLGGGEAGSEVVSGADTLMRMIGQTVRENAPQRSESTVRGIYEYIAGGGLAEDLAENLSKKIKMELDGREVGRVVMKYA